MYTGNGVTAAFPLPEGKDGSAVWLTPPGGDAIKMEQGAAYSIEEGAARFVIPPPEGWMVSFEKPEGTEEMAGGCVVVYADGTMKTVSGDPAEMLEQARFMLTLAREERNALMRLVATKTAEIKLLAETAKATMNGRLLNYSELAEAAIAKAADAAKADARARVEEVITELREGQKDVLAALEEIRQAREAILNAAQTAANEAAEEVKRQVLDGCREGLEAWGRVRTMRPELEEIAEKARGAAVSAGRELRQDMTAQCGVLLEEIRGIRSRLERDVIREEERHERRRAREAEEIAHIRDETLRAAARMDRVEESCRGILTQAREEEGRTKAFVEQAAALETAMNARMLRGTRRGGRQSNA